MKNNPLVRSYQHLSDYIQFLSKRLFEVSTKYIFSREKMRNSGNSERIFNPMCYTGNMK